MGDFVPACPGSIQCHRALIEWPRRRALAEVLPWAGQYRDFLGGFMAQLTGVHTVLAFDRPSFAAPQP